MGFPTKPFKSSFSVIEIILLKDKRFCKSQGRNARVLATLIYVVYHCSRTKRRVSTKGGKYFAISGIQRISIATRCLPFFAREAFGRSLRPTSLSTRSLER